MRASGPAALRGIGLRGVLAALALAAAPGAAGAQITFLDPAGPVAASQRDHLIFVTGMTMIAIVPVLVLVPLIIWRYHRRKGSGRYTPHDHLYRPDWQFSGPLEVVMWGVPFAIVAVLGWGLWHDTMRFDPYKPLGPDPVEVQAIGLDWKWLFLYPDEGLATLDRLVIPEDRPVRIALTTDSVMQSFRISALAGQIYAMPGMRTEVNVMAERPGTMRGENMQYSGRGFPHQNFAVQVLPVDGWDEWTGTESWRVLDADAYAILGRRSTASEAREDLGLLPDEPARFRLEGPDLFEAVIARYHQGRPVPPAAQPGSPAYEAFAHEGRESDG
ncbi:cytochrome o ubiquinol oxidase subunit 2 [Hasllibacter halocynthiae]|uniref:Cytochrome o ubiquinol oxidase subunit 2 n=1 Tax=Hasllibacter halocynthiae TaxID=595589 RepID=A0A2T0X4C9_9RHOB|nr:cytochrome ubiquinol oxidase subunit II [Hasllibacter halocynthiae]PRY93798.1 cytochrome o ubiquinol oxidase subunit 2 [Hasllibacter halocynthiae]